MLPEVGTEVGRGSGRGGARDPWVRRYTKPGDVAGDAVRSGKGGSRARVCGARASYPISEKCSRSENPRQPILKQPILRSALLIRTCGYEMRIFAKMCEKGILRDEPRPKRSPPNIVHKPNASHETSLWEGLLCLWEPSEHSLWDILKTDSGF